MQNSYITAGPINPKLTANFYHVYSVNNFTSLSFYSQKEHRMEIDSRVPVFEKFNSFGQSLLDERHSSSEEIDEKLKEVQSSRQNLER